MTNYFSHDLDAHKDPKCSALIAGQGYEGYGIYWCLIELLHEQGGKIEKFPKLYEGLAYQFHIGVKQIEALLQALISDYKLLEEDEKYIWSNRVLRNLEEREKKKISKQEAGRIGGYKSGKLRLERKQKEAALQKNEANEPNKRKVKESKVNKSILDEQKARPISPVKERVTRERSDKQQVYDRICEHLEKTLDMKITTWSKQHAAIKDMLDAGYTEIQIIKTIDYMANKDEFYSDKGFDMTTVAKQIPLYKAQMRKAIQT